MDIAFDNLDIIPELKSLILELKESIELLKPDFTNNKSVMRFLEIESRQTLHNYIEKGIFIENIHYRRHNNKIIWIEAGIIEFKKTYLKHSKSKSDTALKQAQIISKFAA